MIKKFLVVGKQIYLQGKKIESMDELGQVMEIEMPIDTFWIVEDLLKNANYVKSAGGSQGEIFEVYKMVFSKCAPYAIYEKDRKWLYEKS